MDYSFNMSDILYDIYKLGFFQRVGYLKRLWRSQFKGPNITNPTGSLPVVNNKPVFVLVCGPYFDMNVPNAGSTCRLGWCRGFEEIGIPYLLVSIFDLVSVLPELSSPVCWISGSDYEFLDRENLAALKKTKHLVWVNTWFNGDSDYYAKHNFPNYSHAKNLNKKIISSEPSVVFTISPEPSFAYYEMWIKNGLRLVSLPLACDKTLYTGNSSGADEYDGIEMAFVGGYWQFKARQFDRYLKPYEERLTVYGYSPWPYAGYGGLLSHHKEPLLYRKAKVSPTVNEPHVEQMGIDMNERVFKVLGSGGMTVTDVTPGYRSWFTSDELLVPESISDYHDMIKKVLEDEDFNQTYREKGHRAIVSRHTYAHRAKAAIGYLGISDEIETKI